MKEPVFMDKLGFCQQLSMKSAVFMDKPDRRCVPATPASLLIPAAAGCSLQKPTGLLTEALTTPNRGGMSPQTHRLSVSYIEICKELFYRRDQKIFYIRPVHCAVDAYELHLT